MLLLVRDGKSIEPTEMGLELLVHAERILTAHDEAVASLKLRELTGTVRLGCNDEPQIAQVAEIIRAFRFRTPKGRRSYPDWSEWRRRCLVASR